MQAKKRIWKRALLIVAVVAALAAAAAAGLWAYREATLKKDLATPPGTAVILNYSTHDKYSLFFRRDRAEIRYLDAQGTLLATYREPDERLAGYLLETPFGLVYFMDGRTVIADGSDVLTFADENEYSTGPANVPNQTGYIPEVGQAFALIPARYTYVRFVSPEGAYNVELPVQVPTDVLNVSYDAATGRVICLLRNQTYLALDFDGTAKQFRLSDPTPHPVSYGGDGSFTYGMAADGKLLTLTNAVSGTQNLLLTVCDLETGEQLSQRALLEDYPDNGSGYGLETGSPDLPMCISGGRLYAFTSGQTAFAVTDADTVETLSMPFRFSDAVNLAGGGNAPKDFFGLRVHVEGDGNIYVLATYPGNRAVIYRLSDGEYTPVWEAKLPSTAGDMYLCGFEIIDGK